MIATLKLVIVSGNPDPQQMAVVLTDGKIPSVECKTPETFYELFESTTGFSRNWIPFHKKVNFFFDGNDLVVVYVVVLGERTNLFTGQWVPLLEIAPNTFSKLDHEIFQTSIFSI